MLLSWISKQTFSRNKGLTLSKHPVHKQHFFGNLWMMLRENVLRDKRFHRPHIQHKGFVGGGGDESPFTYKGIEKVISYQSDLVDVTGVFHPKIVRMNGKVE